MLAALVVEAAETGAPRQGTVAELMDDWPSHAERDFSPKTALETRRLIERAVNPRLAIVRWPSCDRVTSMCSTGI